MPPGHMALKNWKGAIKNIGYVAVITALFTELKTRNYLSKSYA